MECGRCIITLDLQAMIRLEVSAQQLAVIIAALRSYYAVGKLVDGDRSSERTALDWENLQGVKPDG